MKRIIKHCKVCQKELSIKISQADTQGSFCSRSCMAIWYSSHAEGNYSRTKSGKREDLGIFVRSAWEANWARYLNWLISIGEIQRWQYEAETFEFKRIKRGTRFYTPDFKVTNKDGSIEYHEVKGWMDAKSKTKLDRMARYYPQIKIILIDEPAYRALEREMKRAIAEWE